MYQHKFMFFRLFYVPLFFVEKVHFVQTIQNPPFTARGLHFQYVLTGYITEATLKFQKD
jgi:hypothetical protein